MAERAPRRGDVLVLNAGSSSLKVALVDPVTGKRSRSGLGERLGTAQPDWSWTVPSRRCPVRGTRRS